MTKKWKKSLALPLVVALAVTGGISGGAGRKATADINTTAPTYANGEEMWKNEFFIGAWCEPETTDTQIELFKESGFNVMYLNNAVGYNKHKLRRYKELAEEHDFYYITAMGMNRASPVSIRVADNSKIDLKNDPRFLGVASCDEPLGDWQAYQDKIQAGQKVTPQVKKNEQNGIKQDFNTIYDYLLDEYQYFAEEYGSNRVYDVVIYNSIQEGAFGYKTLESMEKTVLKEMTDKNHPGTISMDSYPFLTSQQGDDETSFACNSKGSFGSMFCVAESNHTAENTSKYAYRIYYYGHQWYDNLGREIYDQSNVSYQIYMSMCFGYNAFTAYRYSGAYWNEFANGYNYCNSFYDLTEYWYYNKQALAELKNFDYLYLPFSDNWQGVMVLEGTQNTRTDDLRICKANIPADLQGNALILESHDRIASVTATQDTLVGAYKDKDGRDGFMFSNQSNACHKLKDTITVKFNNANKLKAVVDGVEKTIDLVDGVATITVNNGGGAFVVPYND